MTYPVTPDQPNAVAKTAAVDDNGWIESITDENGAGYTTIYGYDLMGRPKLVDYPNGDSVAWTSTTQSFAPSTRGLLRIACRCMASNHRDRKAAQGEILR